MRRACLILAVAWALAPVLAAQEVRVFVPCGINGPILDLIREFEGRNPGVRVVANAENVVVLCKRVENGERPDVLLSLGPVEMASLMAKGLLEKGSLRDMARSPLGLVVKAGNPAEIKGLRDLAGPRVRNLALATPGITSLGSYSKQALQAVGIWDKVRQKVVFVKYPTQLLHYLTQGKVDAAIVYKSCLGERFPGGGVRNPKGVKVVGEVARRLHGPSVCQAAVLKGCPNPVLARRLVAFLASPRGQRAFREWGFAPVR